MCSRLDAVIALCVILHYFRFERASTRCIRGGLDLQDTVAEMAKNMKSNKTGATQASASELYDFMKRVRTC